MDNTHNGTCRIATAQLWFIYIHVPVRWNSTVTRVLLYPWHWYWHDRGVLWTCGLPWGSSSCHPPTKLREGNVFTVSHSVQGGYPWSHVLSGVGIFGPRSLPRVGGEHVREGWWYVQGVPTSHCWHLVAATMHTIGKRAVRILLECFLVNTNYEEWYSWSSNLLHVFIHTNVHYLKWRNGTFANNKTGKSIL